jgi:prepilin-type N-terminal cleavage/methylation domain-containing protein
MRSRRQGGFTLIEMLVVMTLIVLLLGMTAMFSAWALDRNRTAAAVTQLTGAAGVARSRAYRDGYPHGIRILANGGNLAITFQYIQSPPVFTPNLLGPTDQTRFVQFEYTLDANSQIPTSVPAPNNPRNCLIYGLDAGQQAQVLPNSLLYLPTLGTWHRILGVGGGGAAPLVVTLDEYPDFSLGAATHLRVYEFGLYAPPRAVLGEEVMQLPQHSCVDLSAGRSLPAGNGADVDILWGPSGRLVTVPPPSPNTGAYGHVFLWVRDPDRPAVPYEQAGEQFLFVAKAQSGAVGSAPIDWGPDNYALGRKAVAGH